MSTINSMRPAQNLHHKAYKIDKIIPLETESGIFLLIGVSLNENQIGNKNLQLRQKLYLIGNHDNFQRNWNLIGRGINNGGNPYLLTCSTNTTEYKPFLLHSMDISTERMVKFDTSIKKPIHEKCQIGSTQPESSESTTNDFYNVFWKSFQFLARLSALRKLYKKLQNEPEFDKKLGILEKKDQLLKEKPLKVTGLTVLYSNTSVLITDNQLFSFKAALLSGTIPTDTKRKIPRHTKERGVNKIPTEKQKEDPKTQVIKQETKELDVPVAKPGPTTPSKKKYEKINKRQMSKLRLEFPEIRNSPKKNFKEKRGEVSQISEPILEVVLPKPKDVTVEKVRGDIVSQEEEKPTALRTPKNKGRLSSSHTVKKPNSSKQRKEKWPYGDKFTGGSEADLNRSPSKPKVKRSPQVKSMTSLNSGKSIYSLYQRSSNINVSELSLNVMDIGPETMVRFAMPIKKQSGDKSQGESAQPESSKGSTKDFYDIYWKSYQFKKRLGMLQKVYKNVQSEIKPDKKIDVLKAKDKLLKETPLKVMGIRVFCSSTSVVLTDEQLPPFKAALLGLKDKFPQDKNQEETENGRSKKTEEQSKYKEFEAPIATPGHTTPSKRKYAKYIRNNLLELRLEFNDSPNTFKMLPREEERRKLSELSLMLKKNGKQNAVKQPNDFERRKEKPNYVDKIAKFSTPIKKKIEKFESTQPAQKRSDLEQRQFKRPYDDKFENVGTPVKKDIGKLKSKPRQGRRLYDDRFENVGTPIKKDIEKLKIPQPASTEKSAQKQSDFERKQLKRPYDDKFENVGTPVKKDIGKLKMPQPASSEKDAQKQSDFEPKQLKRPYDDKFENVGTPVKKDIGKLKIPQPASTEKAAQKQSDFDRKQLKRPYDDKFENVGTPIKKDIEKLKIPQPGSTEKSVQKQSDFERKQLKRPYDDKFENVGTPVKRDIGKLKMPQPASTEKAAQKQSDLERKQLKRPYDDKFENVGTPVKKNIGKLKSKPSQGRRLYDDKFENVGTPFKKDIGTLKMPQPASTEKAAQKQSDLERKQLKRPYDDKFENVGTPVKKNIGKLKSKPRQGRRLYDDKFENVGTPVKKDIGKLKMPQPASTETSVQKQSDFERKQLKRPYDDKFENVGTPVKRDIGKLKMPQPASTEKAAQKQSDLERKQLKRPYDDKFENVGTPVKKNIGKLKSKPSQGRRLYDDKFENVGTPFKKDIGTLKMPQPASTEKAAQKQSDLERKQLKRPYDDKFENVGTPVKKDIGKLKSKPRQGRRLYDDKFENVGTPVKKHIEKVKSKPTQGRGLYDDKFADVGTPVKKKSGKFESTQPSTSGKAIRKGKRPHDDWITHRTSGDDLKMPPPKTSLPKTKTEGTITKKLSEIKLKTVKDDNIEKTGAPELPSNFSVHNLIGFFEKRKKPED